MNQKMPMFVPLCSVRAFAQRNKNRGFEKIGVSSLFQDVSEVQAAFARKANKSKV